MGMASFADNQFAERFAMIFTERAQRDSPHHFFTEVPFRVVRRFTAIQFASCAVIFAITLTPLAVIFPVLIGILIPIRLKLMPEYFNAAYLKCLDPYGDIPADEADDTAAVEGNVELQATQGKAEGSGAVYAPVEGEAAVTTMDTGGDV